MPKITPTEYDPLKAFLGAWVKRFLPIDALPPEHHPIAVLESLEKQSPSKARVGLGLAIGDVLEQAWHLNRTQIDDIDRDFASLGLLTLSELLRRYSRQFRAMLRRGRIRNDQEYYLATGILASVTAGASDEDLMHLGTLVSAYETRAS